MPMSEELALVLPSLGDLVEAFPAWLERAVGLDPRLGYLLLALAMLLENLIPPIPSELIQPLGGFLVQQGRLELVPVILAGVAGTVLGCWFWYGLGRWIGEARLVALIRRHGGWVGLAEADLEAGRRWFARHGLGLVFWGRMVPGIRTLISVPAGLEGMGQLPFLLATIAGSLLWITLLTLLGRALGAGYQQAAAFTGPLGSISRALLLVLAGVAAATLLWRAFRRNRFEV
jgi:membrane protein DedA with SNARE-associated domain